MAVASSVYGLGVVALVAILIAGIATTATVRTRTGSALAVLLVLIAATYVAGILWNADLLADPNTYLARHPWAGLGTAFTEFVDFLLFCITGVALLVVAAISHHWSWLAGLAASTLPMVGLALGNMIPVTPMGYAQDLVPFSAAMLCPLLVGMAYALSR